jgi:hypothetical protein
MTLSQLQLVREMDQLPDEVLLTCFDGAQTILVSIPRLFLDDFARLRGWGPLAPSDQNFLVDNNRAALLALIQWKYEDGQATQRTDRKTGHSMALITLSPSDLDRGINHVTRSTVPFAASLGDTSEEPDLTSPDQSREPPPFTWDTRGAGWGQGYWSSGPQQSTAPRPVAGGPLGSAPIGAAPIGGDGPIEPVPPISPKPLDLPTGQSFDSLPQAPVLVPGEVVDGVGNVVGGVDGAGNVTGTWTEATEPLIDEAGQLLYPVGGASPVTPRAEVVLAANLPGLPIQGPGPHFEFTKDGTIDFVPPAALDREGNNVERLRRLHPALRELVLELSKALASGNAPHATLAGRVEEYRKRIDQPLETVDFSLLYVEGVRLANAERAAREEITRGELPPLAEAEREAIQTILEVHGTFILNTTAGAELIAAEERYQRRPKAEREYRAAAIDFAQSLQNQPAIITPGAAAFVLGAAEQISQGVNPERSGVVGTSVLQNVAVVLAAGAVVAALPIVGNAIAGANGLVIGGLTSLLASESLKKSKPFATVIAPLIAKLDQAARTDFSKIKDFLISIEEKVRHLARKNKNFHWLHKAMDWIMPIGSYMNLNLVRQITEFPISPETIRVLQNDNIVFIGDLVQKTETELLQFPGCDRRMVSKILENLTLVGLHLGMKIEWPPENIEYAIEQLKIMDRGYPRPMSFPDSP